MKKAPSLRNKVGSSKGLKAKKKDIDRDVVQYNWILVDQNDR